MLGSPTKNYDTLETSVFDEIIKDGTCDANGGGGPPRPNNDPPSIEREFNELRKKYFQEHGLPNPDPESVPSVPKEKVPVSAGRSDSTTNSIDTRIKKCKDQWASVSLWFPRGFASSCFLKALMLYRFLSWAGWVTTVTP